MMMHEIHNVALRAAWEAGVEQGLQPQLSQEITPSPGNSTPKPPLKDRLLKKGTKIALNAGFSVTPYIPDSLFPGLVDKTFGAHTTSPQKELSAKWLHNWVSLGHPGVAYIKRLIGSLHPNVRDKYLTGFITNLLFRSQEQTDKIERNRAETGLAPKLAVISPTNLCNLDCDGCYADLYEKGSGLTKTEVQDVINQLKDMGVNFFVISGGEPFVWKERGSGQKDSDWLFEILEDNQDCVFQIYTNGTKINRDIAKRLVAVGNAAPCMSLEGFEQETDTRRKAGTFRKVMEAARYLREEGAMFGFSATGTRRNYINVTSKEFIDMLIREGFNYGWFFHYVPVAKGIKLSVAQNIEDVKALMMIPQERSIYRERINTLRSTQPMLAGDFWNDGCITNGCLAAGRHYIHINARGDIEPCVFEHFAVDNIRKTSIKDALMSGFFQDLRQLTEESYRKYPNLLMPCGIIDRPEILRTAVLRNKARPTHPGAEAVITELADLLDAYSHDMIEVTDPIWKEQYEPWERVYSGKDCAGCGTC